MRQLIVRNVDDDIAAALKRRAGEHGRSAEAEHREILRIALTRTDARPSFREFLASMPDVAPDADFTFERDLPREPR